MKTLVEQVSSFYERHPYPRYPLVAQPIWQEGYLTSSLFAQAICTVPGSHSTRPSACPHTLILGCGEILPFIIRKWEPRATRVTALDLSRRSLARARLRCLRTIKPVHFVPADLGDWLSNPNLRQKFTHIDAYGVLHHLPNPIASLELISSSLVPGGTLRLMVYNSAARRWIHHVQRIFAILEVRWNSAEDLNWARRLLKHLARRIPQLQEKLDAMGSSLLENDARFADAFLHPRESRLLYRRWAEAFSINGLVVRGLLDRYAELDHLPNPLWTNPTPACLQAAASDGTFENNFELFLQKALPPPLKSQMQPRQKVPHALFLKASPRLWWSYQETRKTPQAMRRSIWHSFLLSLAGHSYDISPKLRTLSPHAAQRLSRIGAILPQTVSDLSLRHRLHGPLSPVSGPTLQPPSLTMPVDDILGRAISERHLDSGTSSGRSRDHLVRMRLEALLDTLTNT